MSQEFAFDVDVSQLPCGVNGAIYFVEMPTDGISPFPLLSILSFCYLLSLVIKNYSQVVNLNTPETKLGLSSELVIVMPNAHMISNS